MIDNTYSLQELAELESKCEVPAFMYKAYDLPKPVHPFWRFGNELGLLWGLLMLFGGGILLATYAIRLGPIPLWQSFAIALTPAVITVLGTFKAQTKAEKYRFRQAELKRLAKDLYTLTEWTGYTPAQLASLTEADLYKLADDIMIEACKEVLVFQNEHSEEAPAMWRAEHTRLSEDVGKKYNLFNSFKLVDSGGYGHLYDAARRRLATA